jgi:hypothetical protein
MSKFVLDYVHLDVWGTEVSIILSVSLMIFKERFGLIL